MKLRYTLALLCALVSPAFAQSLPSPNLGTGTQINGTAIGALPLAVTVGGTGASTAAGARTNLGIPAAGADTAYAFRSNNLSDLASAVTARTNLGVTGTGADTAYAFRANNLSDLANIGTARTNLGLGGAATLSVGTAAGTVAAGDDSRITGTVISWTPTISCASGGTVTATSTTFALRETRAGHNKVTWSARVSVSAQSSCSYLQITPPSTPLSALGFSQTAYDESVGALMMSTITAGDAHIIFRGVGNSGTVTTDSYSSNGFYWE